MPSHAMLLHCAGEVGDTLMSMLAANVVMSGDGAVSSVSLQPRSRPSSMDQPLVRGPASLAGMRAGFCATG